MWNTPEPFDPSAWEIVWPYPEVEPAPPRPDLKPPPSVTEALKRFMQQHPEKAYRAHVLAPRVGVRLELVRDRLRSMVHNGHLVQFKNAEGHDVWQWAGKAQKPYTIRQPEKRIRLQGAA